MKDCIKKISLFVLLLVSVFPAAGNDIKLDKHILNEARRFRLKIEKPRQIPAGVSGKMLSNAELQSELKRFFDALDDLGVKFVRQSGLKNVMIFRELKHHGMNNSGFVLGDCMFLKAGFSKKTVYHELFHVFDKKESDPEWSKLNHRDFRYLGVDYPGRPLPAEKRQELLRHYRKVKRDFSADFVSRYAQSKEREDRAETFAAMVDEGMAFVDRAQKSQVLYAKMLYIIRMTGQRKLLGMDFWHRKLGSRITYPEKKRKK